jgi:hypothetical protein
LDNAVGLQKTFARRRVAQALRRGIVRGDHGLLDDKLEP